MWVLTGVLGANSFGVTLIPLLFGIAILFFNGRSTIGWLLTAAGALFILAGVIANMHIYFQPATLFHTLVMLVLLVGGLGLIAKSMRRIVSRQPNSSPLINTDDTDLSDKKGPHERCGPMLRD